jgi:hypothetical protein
MPQRSMPAASAFEQCSRCLQLYSFEYERRCYDCDGPLCPFCVERIEARWICLECKEGSDDRARNVEG